MKKIFLFATLILGLGLMSCQSPESKARKALQEHFYKKSSDPKAVTIRDLKSVNNISFTKREIETLDIELKRIDKQITIYNEWLAEEQKNVRERVERYRSAGLDERGYLARKNVYIKKIKLMIDNEKYLRKKNRKKKIELENLVGTLKEVITVEWVFNVDVNIEKLLKYYNDNWEQKNVNTEVSVFNKLNTDSFFVIAEWDIYSLGYSMGSLPSSIRGDLHYLISIVNQKIWNRNQLDFWLGAAGYSVCEILNGQYIKTASDSLVVTQIFNLFAYGEQEKQIDELKIRNQQVQLF